MRLSVCVDTYIGFLRLLIFVYTSTLPEGSDGQVLEDLMAADRYGIADMRALCESMLLVNDSNWLDFLRAGSILSLSKLSADAEEYIRCNAQRISASSHCATLTEEFPGLLERLLAERDPFSLPPCEPYKTRIREALKDAKKKSDLLVPSFPLAAAGTLIAFAAAYKLLVENVQLGSLIPIINVAFLVGIVVYAYVSATGK